MHKNFLKYIIFFGVSLVLVSIDQYTKFLAKTKLYNQPPYVVIDDVIEFLYVENTGAAFGILKDRQSFFFVLTVVILAAILILLYKLKLERQNIFYYIILIFLFSGAIGNFIDRVKNKYVVDFIYFKPINFPVFNFADILITLSMIFLILLSIVTYKND